MSKRASNVDRAELEPAAAEPPEGEVSRTRDETTAPGAVAAGAGPWSRASHEALFAPVSASRCDACGCDLDDDDPGADRGGRGVYMWARGDEVRFEDAPLCASCASAIGMTALARWEIEEEEG